MKTQIGQPPVPSIGQMKKNIAGMKKNQHRKPAMPGEVKCRPEYPRN
jgi:hypothetical protein